MSREQIGGGDPDDHDEAHDIESLKCWCGPEIQCAYCGTPNPCIHGDDRPEIVIHKEAS